MLKIGTPISTIIYQEFDTRFVRVSPTIKQGHFSHPEKYFNNLKNASIFFQNVPTTNSQQKCFFMNTSENLFLGSIQHPTTLQGNKER